MTTKTDNFFFAAVVVFLKLLKILEQFVPEMILYSSYRKKKRLNHLIIFSLQEAIGLTVVNTGYNSGVLFFFLLTDDKGKSNNLKF